MTAHHDALRALLEQKIAFELRAGLLSEELLAEQLAVIIEEELGAFDEALWQEQLPRVREGMTAQLAREQTWTDRTVNDELDAALVCIAEHGIIGLQANGTTVQHGWAIAEAVAAAHAPSARGAVFYHLQDLERGVAGEGLTLGFGAFDPAEIGAVATRSPPPEDATVTLTIQRHAQNVEGHGAPVLEATRRVGEDFVAVLRQHGLAPTWDGSPRTRIMLPPFAWQKRRQTTPPPAGPRPELVLPSSIATPAPPSVCPDCDGKGWLPPLVPGDFSDFCWCKGGKRPRPGATAAPFVGEAPARPEMVAPAVQAGPAMPSPPANGVFARWKKWFGGGGS
jgi:hypothetical protein